MPSTNITTQTRYVKEGDDFYEIVTLPSTITQDVSAYTNWSAYIMDAATITTDVSAAAISAGVIVYDNPARQILVQSDKSGTDNLVAEGKTERKLYSDIQADDINGVTSTLIQLQWVVKRKYKPSS